VLSKKIGELDRDLKKKLDDLAYWGVNSSSDVFQPYLANYNKIRSSHQENIKNITSVIQQTEKELTQEVRNYNPYWRDWRKGVK
jgi:hypothetical protein